MQKKKILLVYNETNPELYVHKSDLQESNLSFQPYFDVGNSTPMEEFAILAKLIEEGGFAVVSLNLNDSFQVLLDALERDPPDAVFNCVEIFYSKALLEMNIAGVFELLGIPYTGSPSLTLANCQNKSLTKKILRENGIPTPEYEISYTPEQPISLNCYPLIVKPIAEDASIGIENASVVYTPEQLRARVQFIHREFKQPALIEQFIAGRELNVAVLGGVNPVVLPISEIDFSEMPDHLEKIVSYQAKWDSLHEAYHRTIPICPSILPDDVRSKVEAIALRVYHIMELRDYCRVDIRINADFEPFVLEANPNPDLSEGAGFMRSAEAADYTYQSIIKLLIDLALSRTKKTLPE